MTPLAAPIVSACLSCMPVGAAPAVAAAPFATTTPMSAAELAGVRAGYVNAAGVEFSFSVLTQTLINGQLGLSTQLNVGDSDAASRSVAGAPGTSFVNGVASVTLPGAGGSTTLLQSFTPNQIANLVSTSANNQTVAQSTSVILNLAGFDQNQASYGLQHTMSNINNLIGLSAIMRR